MPFHISASSIKDFVTCERRHYFRLNYSGEQEQNADMAAGSVVHNAIERFWDDERQAREYMSDSLASQKLGPTHASKVKKSIDNFFFYFQFLLSPEDLIEQEFRVPYSKGVDIVGKYDRILKDGTLIDWKTSARPPEDISNDPQFIIYYESYRKLYGSHPTNVLYVALVTGKVVRYVPNPEYTGLLYNQVIPEMIKKIKRNEYHYTGLFRYKACEYCAFKTLCQKELEGVR